MENEATQKLIKKEKYGYCEHKRYSKAILKGATNEQKELEYLGLRDNWYLVKLPTMSKGWVKWKDINLIYQNKTNPVRLTKEEKAGTYE